MLGFFGVGIMELLIIGMLGLMIIGVPVIIIAVVLLVNRKGVQNEAKPCPKCGMLAPKHGYCPHCGAPMDVA